ncbi:hypothetical protein Tco_0628928 [Tanacetum coccineum]|uniref:Uncharacterized protein n=1 Tax=Tanacetum coccineum TaxID=301880 RepID=A0ABQ4WRQ6_9ASTR
MIACVEKTAQNADFYQIIDFLTGCSINYSLLVDPDLIGPWLQQFWATASLRVINDVPHIRAMVAGKKILISEETIRADLLFDDANGVDCFPKQVIWDLLRDIGYEGNLAQLTFSKPLFSPQWKITPLTPPMLEVVTALAAEEEHSTSPHSRAASSARDAQGTPTQSAAQASISTAQDTAGTQGTAPAQDTAEVQGTDNSQGTANLQGTAAIPKSPNDYTPTDASQTSGGDEGLLDLYALNREVRRLKKQTLSQAKQIHKLKAKLKKLSKFVQPVVKHHAFWVESQNLKKRRKRQRKKHKKKVSSVKLGKLEEELDLETFQVLSTSGVIITPRTLIFDDEAQPSKKVKLRTETVDELRNYLRIIDFEKNAQDRESLEGISMITELQIDQDLYTLIFEVVSRTNYEHIPPTGLGLILLGDLTTIWETAETSDDDFWKNQEDWEIVRWRLNESSGVHTLELEDGTMIHMLA